MRSAFGACSLFWGRGEELRPRERGTESLFPVYNISCGEEGWGLLLDLFVIPRTGTTNRTKTRANCTPFKETCYCSLVQCRELLSSHPTKQKSS